MKIAIVGASGAVGQEFLKIFGGSAAADRRVAVVRLGAQRGPHLSVPRCGSDRSAAAAQRRFPGRRLRPDLGRSRHFARIRRDDHAPRCRDDRQLERLPHGGRRAAGGARGQPRGCQERPAPHHRQPQLHDDPDGRGAERHRAAVAYPPRACLDLPVGQRRRVPRRWTNSRRSTPP